MKILNLLFLILPFASLAQTLVVPSTRWSTQPWEARWVGPTENKSQYGIYHFRKTFSLSSPPEKFIIHISADNRYRFFVNGIYVTEGPQLSDLRHWKFESLDISKNLKQGENTLAIQVAYLGEVAPVFMMGKQAALIVQGDDAASAIVNTDKTWKYKEDESVSPIVFKPGQKELFFQYYAAGPLEKVDGNLHPWGWEQPTFNDTNWTSPSVMQNGTTFRAEGYGDAQWELTPRNIPLMEHSYEELNLLRRWEGKLETGIKAGAIKFPLKIPANQKVTLLFDNRKLTSAFPEFVTTGGKGAEIKAIYAEALFDDIKNKGHRDSIAGKSIHGVYDIFLTDGGSNRLFTSISYRTFRYVQFDIITGDQPLTITKLGSWFTGYPFEKKAIFTASDPQLSNVFDIGFHTARLCAYDTYMDCPYWERLQYIGDTRIQAFVSYYVTGDDRLARNAIEQFEWSMTYDGLTYSRYPSELPQFIPNYSLVWITMVHDYFKYRNDPQFVKSFLPGIRRVIEHFEQYLTEDKMMRLQPYWDFFDHSFSAKKIAAESQNKTLTNNTLFFAYVLDMSAELFAYYKENGESEKYAKLSRELKAAVQKNCWDSGRGLYADSPDKKHFSMHNNIMAILCDIVPPTDQAALLRKISDDQSITKTTLYFDFYLGRAMSKAGAGDQYYDLLDKWKDLLKLGLTTFPEGVDRSECHAWSASPDFEMLATFCGIESDGPGFEKVLIRPQLQSLSKVQGSIPHWAGNLEVNFEKKGEGLSGKVILPKGITGKLVWNLKTMELREGENNIRL